MLKYLWYINLFFAALAYLNMTRLDMVVKQIYRRKTRLTLIEWVIHSIMSIMYCLIPLLNIALAFTDEKKIMERVSKDERYEKRVTGARGDA